jgi:arabinogalactan endo-1,4-beta-galactosidase
MQMTRRAIALVLLLAALAPVRQVAAEEYAVGADLSFLADAEAHGKAFKDRGEVKPGLAIFRDHGYNWIRLRLFHSPTELPNNLEYTIALAKDAKQRGFKFLLNYHYSDTWADPEKQFLPKAWEGLSHDELEQAVFEYTRDSLVACREAGVMPEMVQIGNEVIGRTGRILRSWCRPACAAWTLRASMRRATRRQRGRGS